MEIPIPSNPDYSQRWMFLSIIRTHPQPTDTSDWPQGRPDQREHPSVLKQRASYLSKQRLTAFEMNLLSHINQRPGRAASTCLSRAEVVRAGLSEA